MQIALAVLVSLLPAAVLLAAVWLWLFRRRHSGIFWTAFGFGVAATLIAILLQVPLLDFAKRAFLSPGAPLALLLVVAALIEEAAKTAAWYASFGIFRRPIKLGQGVAAGTGAVAALAFAGIENLLFNVGLAAKQGMVNWDVVIARAGATVPLHATTGLLIGLIAWRIHGARRGGPGAWIALFTLPFLLHAGFNVIQAISGTRQRLTDRLGLEQWAWIGAAGLLVWVVAALAIRYYVRQRRAARRMAHWAA